MPLSTISHSITDNYHFQFRDLVIGPSTGYDIVEVVGLLGFTNRSDSVSRFGRHGGVGGRHYAEMKYVTIKGNILATSASDFETKRHNLAKAFIPIPDFRDALPLITQSPANATNVVFTYARPVDLDLPEDRAFALKYASFSVRLELIDPILYKVGFNSQTFSQSNATHNITTVGNADAKWLLELVGPAVNPVITNEDTGQSISFTALTLTGEETLVLDSGASTVKVNGTSQSVLLSNGFSWWDLASPATTSISVSATDATASACTLYWRDAYWIN